MDVKSLVVDGFGAFKCNTFKRYTKELGGYPEPIDFDFPCQYCDHAVGEFCARYNMTVKNKNTNDQY